MKKNGIPAPRWARSIRRDLSMMGVSQTTYTVILKKRCAGWYRAAYDLGLKISIRAHSPTEARVYRTA